MPLPDVRRKLKSLLESAAVHFPSYRPLFGRETYLRRLLGDLRIDTVLDVGACVGDYALELRKWGFRGRIFSFEPVPASYALMCQNLKNDPLWTGLPFGLSDKSGTAVMHTYAARQFNSLLTLKDDAEQAYELDHSRRTEIQIQLRRLDEVLPELLAGRDGARVFLKMDTQGHDVNVLNGASGVMQRITAMQSEVPAVEIYEGMPSLSQALETYRGYGFVPVGFYPVNTFWDTHISPEFDVILTRFQGKLAKEATSSAGAPVLAPAGR